MAKLFVANIPWKATEEDFRTLFESCGEVQSAIIIMDKDNPTRSKGFGFVEMDNIEDAIVKLNGADFQGRALIVKKAEERPPRNNNR